MPEDKISKAYPYHLALTCFMHKSPTMLPKPKVGDNKCSL